MGWAKFDDRWASHPKLLAAGLEAAGLDGRGICYCAGQETDGFVPDGAVLMLAAGHRQPHKLAAKLVEYGRWTRDEEKKGYWIHDYLDYNHSHEEAEAKRESERVRKASGRTTQGRDGGGRVTSGRNPGGIQAEGAGIPGGVPPVPTRPDLKDTHSSSVNHQSGEPPPDEEDDSQEAKIQDLGLEVANRRLERQRARGANIGNPRAWLATTTESAVIEIRHHLNTDPTLTVEQLVAKVAPDLKPTPSKPLKPEEATATAERRRQLAKPCDDCGSRNGMRVNDAGDAEACPTCNAGGAGARVDFKVATG